MSDDRRPKSTGRKAFERNWRLAQAEAKRAKYGGCVVFLACIACAIFAASVLVTAAFFTQPGPGSPPSTGTTTMPRSLP